MIAIGCDHAGYNMKIEVCSYLTANNIPFLDLGCDGTPCDYPVIAKAVCDKIVDGSCSKGILICGTGIGMSIAANKVNGIRAAVCSDVFSTKYTRMHNDANVMCMGARVLGTGLALELVKVFLHEQYEGGRHQNRLDLIRKLETHTDSN